jgi:HK97 family phage major capsid protein
VNLQELRQKYSNLCDSQQVIIDKAVTENRAMSDEEKTQFSALQTQIDGLADTIKIAESVQNRAAALDAPADPLLRPGQVSVGNDRAADKPWKNNGEFLHAVYAAGQPGATADVRLVYNAASGLSSGVPSDGGFLVGTQMESELLTQTHDTATLAPLCRKIPIGEGFDGLQMNAVDESSRANGNRWGGIVVYRKNEADAATASKPKFRKVELSLEDMVGLCYATDRLLRDATALEAVIKQGFAEEFAFKLDDEIAIGTGAGECLGYMNSPALVTVPKETGQAARTIVYENIVRMWSRMWARSRKNAIWTINQDIEPQLYTMSLSVGTGGVPVYMPPGGASDSPYGTLFGRPVVPIEQASTLGTAGDISLTDLSQYLLIDKGTVESASSIHVRFLYGENTFRFTYSVNGQPIWNKPMTPKNGSNTLSPFVTLATRA